MDPLRELSFLGLFNSIDLRPYTLLNSTSSGSSVDSSLIGMLSPVEYCKVLSEPNVTER